MKQVGVAGGLALAFAVVMVAVVSVLTNDYSLLTLLLKGGLNATGLPTLQPLAP